MDYRTTLYKRYFKVVSTRVLKWNGDIQGGRNSDAIAVANPVVQEVVVVGQEGEDPQGAHQVVGVEVGVQEG